MAKNKRTNKKYKEQLKNPNIEKNEEIEINIENNNETKSEYKNFKEYKDLKLFVKDFFYFFKKKLLKKQIIFFILMLIIFGYFVITYISNLKNEDFLAQIQNINKDYVKPNAFNIMIKENIPNVSIIVVSGVAPYIYAPALGVLCGYKVALNMISIIAVPNASYNLVFMLIGAIITFIGYSLASATGLTFCSYSTKRTKYANKSVPNFLDFKKELYSMTNNNKKLKEIEKKKKEKNIKIQKYNVKTPYLFIVTSFILSLCITLIGTFIFYM